jgi:hypothetical protein
LKTPAIAELELAGGSVSLRSCAESLFQVSEAAGLSLRLRLLAGWLAVLPIAAAAEDIAGIRLADRASVGRSELVLNGAGLRKKVFFKVYVASLYLTEKTTSPAGVYTLRGPKRIGITLLRDVSPSVLVSALNYVIRDNSSPAELRALEGRLAELSATLLALPEGRKGDVITLDWLPDAGTRVGFNDEARGNAVPGDDVYRALLRVWVGDKPTSTRLKKALLGQTG